TTPAAEDAAQARAPDVRSLLLCLLAVPALAMLLVACAMPPGTIWRVEALGYDVMSYHLQLPREWIGAGGWRGYPHNVYSFFPSPAATLSRQVGLLTDPRGGAIGATTIYAAQFLHASAAIMTALALGSAVTHLVGRTLGVLAGVLLLTVPWTMILGSLAYNE